MKRGVNFLSAAGGMKKKLLARTIIAATAFLVLTSLAPNTNAAPVAWTNGHYYEVIEEMDMRFYNSWEEAESKASSLEYNGWAGHLATITSQDENDFIVDLARNAECGYAWIGGSQSNNNDGTGDNWGWVTGESFAYTIWDTNDGQPDDLDKNEDGQEDCLELRSPPPDKDGVWNDQACSHMQRCYVVEYEPPDLPDIPPLPSQTQAVPTLNQWGLIVFGILLAGSAAWFIRKHKKTS